MGLRKYLRYAPNSSLSRCLGFKASVKTRLDFAVKFQIT
jgi:hypothetical protein